MNEFNKGAYLISKNGISLHPGEAHLSLFDRGFLFGDSVYEVIGSYDGVLFTLNQHLERLFQSAALLAIHPTQSLDMIRNWCLELFQKINKPRVYLRVILTRGEGPPDISIIPGAQTNVFMMIRENPPYPEAWYKNGISLVCSPIHRNPKSAVDPNAKSGNYLNNILALIHARNQGADDALMLNKEGYLTEATTANIWFVEDGVLKTPAMGCGILRGITREIILSLTKKLGIGCEEGYYRFENIKGASEIFISSSTKEIVPVSRLDGVKIALEEQSSITTKLMSEYHRQVQSEVLQAKKLNKCYT